MTLALVRV